MSDQTHSMNDLAWDEDRTGNRDPRSLVSLPDNHPFFLATSKAIDWASCGDEDVGRVVTPCVFGSKPPQICARPKTKRAEEPRLPH